MSFLQFIKNKGIIAAAFMAIFYQIIMIGIFIPGYSAIPNNIDQLKVAIVNEDNQYGKTISENFKKQLPFKEIEMNNSLKESKEMLNDRDIHLIIRIPSDFTSALQSGKSTPDIDFYLNEANPATITSTMNSVVNLIGTELGKEFSLNKAKGVLASLNIPEVQASQMAESIQNSIKTNIVSLNKVPDGMNNQMAPMFLTMVSYVGAMIAALMLNGVFKGVKDIIGRKKAFIYLQVTNILLSFIAPIVGISITYLVHGYGGATFFHLWMHHSLELFVALQFTSVFILLFGQGGMLVNLPLLLSQTIAGGAVVPRSMMYGFFRIISYISPMYYSIQADFTILFGGGDLAKYDWSLILIGIVALVINILTLTFRYKETSHEKLANVA